MDQNIYLSSIQGAYAAMFDNNVHCDGKIGLVDDLSLLNQELPGGEFNKYIGTEYIDMDYESLSFTYKGLMLMCDKVTHVNLIDNQTTIPNVRYSYF